MRQILFIDRDGTICKEPHDEQVDQIEKIELLDDVIPSLLSLQKAGYELVMISNQDGLGTSSFPQEDFDKPHNFLLRILESQGIRFKNTLICPHFPADNCECRKPRTGLVMSYLRDPAWSRPKSAVIGDRDSDLELAKNMGITGIRVSYDKASQPGITWKEICRQLLDQERTSTVIRKTKETEIEVSVNLDRSDECEIATGISFFDHMLEQIARHGNIGLKVLCRGDTHVDDHHSVEDVGIALGQCIREALGMKVGIERYGFLLPMDDVQAKVALDLGGRPYFIFEGQFARPNIGELATEMIPHFFRSIADALGANLHMTVSQGNEHHMAEALFKGFARTLKQAIRKDDNGKLPSTKGTL